MRDQLIGHLLGALEPKDRQALESELEHDAELRRELEVLRQGVDWLECDGQHCEPPEGLYQRTCTLVAQRGPSVAAAAGRASTSTRWGLHDVLVAASILVAAGMLFVPAVNQSRGLAERAQCQNNLRGLGVAMQQYSDAHQGKFPEIPLEGQFAAAGVYAPKLLAGGYLRDPSQVTCPGCPLSEKLDFQVPTLKELSAAPQELLKKLHRLMGGSYGYSLGHLEDGQYVPTRNEGRSHFALMADTPCGKEPAHASRNHSRCGQNVLFEDGHVTFDCDSENDDSGDHHFLNTEGQRAVGAHRNDAVIVPSHVRPQLPSPSAN